MAEVYTPLKGDLWAYSQACNDNDNWLRFRILINGEAFVIVFPTFNSLRRFVLAMEM
jgi:hypothetical protein